LQSWVCLDAERQIARVVFKQATADFAQQEGPSLEPPTADFTVNAIATILIIGELIDPPRLCKADLTGFAADGKSSKFTR